MFVCLTPCMSLGLASSEPAAAANEFEPQKTFVVIAGVLQWPSKNGVSGFATEHRKDQELYDTLEKRGVPKEQMTLLLDSEATIEGMRNALVSVLERTTPGTTFIFYYAGHGGKDSFMNYDNHIGGFYHSEITKAVKEHFKGENVLLMADCCYSGGLGVVAKELAAAGFKAASLTAADILNASTGNWTFTQTILDALNGSVLCDGNNDGVITLGEAAAEVASEMAYREHQANGYTLAGLTDSWQLAKTKGTPIELGPAPGNFKLKEYVQAPNGKHPRIGRIIGWLNGQYLVGFYDYSDKKLVPFDPEQLSAVEYKTFEPGTTIAVAWRKEPVAAKVVRQQHGFHHVSYLGWPDCFDEWVHGNRLLGSPEEHPVRQDIVLVERKDRWCPATIVLADTEQKRYFVHYVGEEATADEWVPETRLKKVDPAP